MYGLCPPEPSKIPEPTFKVKKSFNFIFQPYFAQTIAAVPFIVLAQITPGIRELVSTPLLSSSIAISIEDGIVADAATYISVELLY